MNRRVFDTTLQSLKASVLDHAAIFFRERGMTFDVAGYNAQASLDLDDFAKELAFFGANYFPSAEEDVPANSNTIAA